MSWPQGGELARHRARAAAEKAARRTQILLAAGKLFDARQGRLDALTMSALAREVGLAKGTLYLYFRTKEEIFLALVLDELRLWVGALDKELELADAGPEAVASALAGTLLPRTRLLRLLGLIHPVLEQNLAVDRIVEFKRALLTLTESIAARIEALSPTLGPGDGQRLLRRMFAVVIGLQLSTQTPPRVARALAAAGLDIATPQLSDELEQTLAALLRGWRSA